MATEFCQMVLDDIREGPGCVDEPEIYMSPCNEMYAVTQERGTKMIVVHKYGLRRNVFYKNQVDGKVYCYFKLWDGQRWRRQEQYRAAFPDLSVWTPIDEEPEWTL